MRPEHTPIGLQLGRTAGIVRRAFDAALTEAGGSLPVWLVLLNLTIRRVASQRELAQAVGVSPPTLTHHLGAMEADGLIVRRRDPADRRNRMIELTDAGEAAFARLRDVAARFDARLRAGFEQQELAALDAQLTRLAANVGAAEGSARPAWAGLIGSAGEP
jgi:MarR family transcriptional regulator for hemolysin